ncbi:MAG: hypothetical protein ACUVWR_06580 [Anaerolineae bacterium]
MFFTLLLMRLLTACGAQPLTMSTFPVATPPCAPSGYCVLPEFAAFYREHGALLGPPISGPLVVRNRLVQYFPAGRLELVLENPPGYEVGLAYLAEETCGRQPPLHHSDVPSYLERDKRYYPQTGHSLQGEFLHFVEANGDTDFFGYPISEQRQVGEEVVQDFVRVQLRHRADGSFYLADLGTLVMTQATPPPGLCPSVPADDPNAQPGQADGGQGN